MEVLRNRRKEEFCRFIAIDNCDPPEAAYKAGYGRDKHPTVDHYHAHQASRLLEDDDVVKRINTLRQTAQQHDYDFKAKLIQRLKDILDFNPLRYYESNNVKMNNGRTVTDLYLKTQIQDWDIKDGALVTGFDTRGMPKFIDKQWAIEKLIKLYGLDTSDKVDIEDMLGLFVKANLPPGDFYNAPDEPANLPDNTDDDFEDDE